MNLAIHDTKRFLTQNKTLRCIICISIQLPWS